MSSILTQRADAPPREWTGNRNPASRHKQQHHGDEFKSNDLLSSLSGLLTPELLGKAASFLGDSEPAPAALPLAKFYFEVDQSELPVAREGSLESVIEYLKANPTAVATVSGYHDPTGDAAHNEELAKNRATTVRDAMMAAGVPEAQIDMGKPIVTTGGGDLAEARRVEVAIRP